MLCIYIYRYVYIYIYIHIYTHIHIYIYIYSPLSVSLCMLRYVAIRYGSHRHDSALVGGWSRGESIKL